MLRLGLTLLTNGYLVTSGLKLTPLSIRVMRSYLSVLSVPFAICLDLILHTGIRLVRHLFTISILTHTAKI